MAIYVCFFTRLNWYLFLSRSIFNMLTSIYPCPYSFHISIYIYLPIYLPTYLSINLSFPIPTVKYVFQIRPWYPYLQVSFSIFLSIYVSLSICLSANLSIYRYLHACISIYIIFSLPVPRRIWWTASTQRRNAKRQRERLLNREILG